MEHARLGRTGLGGDLSTRGVTEEIPGGWLRGRRDRFILTTKCFAPTGPAPAGGLLSGKHVRSAPPPEGSRFTLGTARQAIRA